MNQPPLPPKFVPSGAVDMLLGLVVIFDLRVPKGHYQLHTVEKAWMFDPALLGEVFADFPSTLIPARQELHVRDAADLARLNVALREAGIGK